MDEFEQHELDSTVFIPDEEYSLKEVLTLFGK